MADSEEVLESGLPRSKKVKKKPKCKSIKKIIASDGFRIVPDLAFNGGDHSVLEIPETLSPQYLHTLLKADTEEVPENRLDGFRIVPDLAFNGGGHSVLEIPKTLSPQYLHTLLKADTEEVPENRLDGFRIVPDLAFNGGGQSVLEIPKTLSPQYLHTLLKADTEEVPENRLDGFRIVPDLAFNGGGHSDREEVPENRLPRSKKVKKKPKCKSIKKKIASDGFRIVPDLAFNGGGHSDREEVPKNRLPRSKKVKKKPKCKSIKKKIASDGFRIVPDLAFNGVGHSVFKRSDVPPFRLDDLKLFHPRLEKNKEELIGLLSSKKKEEKLRKILINQKDGNIGLDDCINFIWNSLGIIDEPNLALEEEAEEFLLKQPKLFQVEAATEDDDPIFTTEHPVLAGTSAESESRGGIESNLMALIKNLEQQVACIIDLIRYLEVDGSSKVEMDRVIRRLFVLLGNEKRNISFLV